ncbi:MAG TPA: M4 family metallopeptidase [Hyphomicrobiaceae bacterium]|jgi:Zn-dependent metalloprotease|nr:M4 family metallopeptidase [Hyphomicrobiaceae bacterium]
MRVSVPFTGLVVAVGASLLAVGILSLMPSASAQDLRGEVTRAVDELRKSNQSIAVEVDRSTGLPTSMKGLTPRPDPSIALTATRSLSGEPSEDDVRRAVEAFMATSQIRSAFPQGNAQERKVVTQVRRDPDIKGQSVAHVTQRLNGIPVFGSSAKYVVNPALAVTDITASYSTVAISSTTPSITADEAATVARAHVRDLLSKRARDPGLDRLFSSLDSIQPKSELTIFDPALLRTRGANPGALRLTWLVSVDSLRVFVDAENRNVLFFYRDHPSIMVRRVYDLSSNNVFPGQKVLDEETNERVDLVPADAMRAFQNTGFVRDFFYIVLGRSGLEATGSKANMPLESYVRYSSEQNARWCKDQSVNCPKANVMVYGPGFAGALDVVGHEVTHGIIAHEADLVYADESGAVNEALADIFGTLIEFQARDGAGNWAIGESLPGYSEVSPMRSMAEPHLKGPGSPSLFNKTQPFSVTNRGQPDHYSEYVARTDALCDTTWDYLNGCVHFNSGVLNKLAFLISEGGEHKGQTVNGIGRQKLARIAYRALTTKLNATSSLVHAADSFVSACADLAGAAAGITAQDCVQVENARRAVGLGTDS